MTFSSVFTTAASVVGIFGLAVLCGAAVLMAVADLSGHDLIPVRVNDREDRS